jgi:hypothetical protein
MQKPVAAGQARRGHWLSTIMLRYRLPFSAPRRGHDRSHDQAPCPGCNAGTDITLFQRFRSSRGPGRIAIARGEPRRVSVRDDIQRTVVVAMIAMRMVQAPVDQIIHVVAMGDSLMAAARAMPMRRIMSTGAMLRRAAIGIRCRDFDDMLIDSAIMNVMQMAVVEIVDMAPMRNRDVTAARPMDVIGVNRTIGGGHECSFPELLRQPPRTHD